MKNLTFTPEEISVIDKTMGKIIFDWAKDLIGHVLTIARESGVEVVYMNTPKSLAVHAPVNNPKKAEYVYNKLPPLMGFKKEKVNLRGKGKEELWAHRFYNVKDANSNKFYKMAEKMRKFTLEELPSKYQGAFVSIIGKQPFYTDDDIRMVLSILKNRANSKGEIGGTFHYDWESRKWNRGQLFNSETTETVVLQRLSDEIVEKYASDPIISKFLALLTSIGKHFSDEIGFALISKITPKIWVINQVQTDCVNIYMDKRNEYRPSRKDEYKKRKKSNSPVSWDVLKDMLAGRERNKCIAKLEEYPDVKNRVLNNPSLIDQLPDDNQDDKSRDNWFKNQANTGNLTEQLANTNFNTRIFRNY